MAETVILPPPEDADSEGALEGVLVPPPEVEPAEERPRYRGGRCRAPPTQGSFGVYIYNSGWRRAQRLQMAVSRLRLQSSARSSAWL